MAAYRALLLMCVVCALPAMAAAESLLAFYRRALETSPTLRSSEFGVEQSKAQEEIAAAKLLPRVSANGNYYWNHYRESGLAARDYDGKRASLQASQALLDLSSYYKLQAARAEVEQREQEQKAARAFLARDVIDRYFTVLQATDEFTQLQSEKEAVQTQLKRVRFMRERGLARLTDLFEVEAYYQGLLTREIEAGAARALALERLREASGLAAERVAPLARESFAPVPGHEAQWTSDAVANNPVLTALQQAIEMTGKMLESGRAEHWPTVALNLSQTYSDQGYDNRLTPTYNVGTVGVMVNIPLYEGGRVKATVREANARLGLARERYEGARREVEVKSRTAYLGARTNHARIGSTNQEVRALEKVVDAQQKSYELGVATVVDMLLARQRLFKARSDQSKARYDYIREFTTLRMYAGRLTDRDVEEIDSWMVKREPARAQPRNAKPQSGKD